MNIDAKKRRQQRIKQLNPSQQSWQDWREAPTKNQFMYRCLICLIIYILIWTVFQLEHSYALRTQHTIRNAMDNSFDYVALTTWYQAHIGEIPSLLPAYNEGDDSVQAVFTSPVVGQKVAVADNDQTVVKLSTTSDRIVTTIGRGLVQSVGSSNDNGMVVSVLHTDGVEAIYAGLESVQVERNDWLEEGAIIGHTGTLYFAIKVGDQYVNPEDVIPID